MRRAEGERLRAASSSGRSRPSRPRPRASRRSPRPRATSGRSSLRERLRALVGELGLDDARLYQEVVRAVERHDVAEEVQRLRSHVAMARELLRGRRQPSGKRLDFLAQELMREANTVGSKVAGRPRSSARWWA